MTAIERYEQTWNRFLLRIDEDSSVTLISIQKENHVNISGMSRWMTEHGLSATESKKLLKVYQQVTGINKKLVYYFYNITNGGSNMHCL